MKLILTGVPGSGKSTICNKLKEKQPEIKIVNYGDLIFKAAKEIYPNKIQVRDDVRKIPRLEYKELQIESALKITRINHDLIVDTHMSLKTPQGYYPGLTMETIKIINPDVIITLKLNPKDILERRKKDIISKTRMSRDVEKIKEIEKHQNVNEMYAVSYSTIANCYFLPIDLTWKQRYIYEHTDYVVSEIIKILNYKF
ncbi:MAG: adenylate kinase [Candidatus Odinarchaeia archaeon]